MTSTRLRNPQPPISILNRLGAIVRHYIPISMASTSSPRLHRKPPHRPPLAEWHLDSKRGPPPTTKPPSPTSPPTPPKPPPQSTSPTRIHRILNLHSPIQHPAPNSSPGSPKHYAATSLRFTPTGPDYLLQPWSDFLILWPQRFLACALGFLFLSTPLRNFCASAVILILLSLTNSNPFHQPDLAS